MGREEGKGFGKIEGGEKNMCHAWIAPYKGVKNEKAKIETRRHIIRQEGYIMDYRGPPFTSVALTG